MVDATKDLQIWVNASQISRKTACISISTKSIAFSADLTLEELKTLNKGIIEAINDLT